MEHNIKSALKGFDFTILVGIDVAKDKHDCFIQTAEGKVLHKPFTIANNCEGFAQLYSKILDCNDADIKISFR